MNRLLFSFCAVILFGLMTLASSSMLNGCASVFPAHPLPPNDFLTLWEVHDTSYCAGRSVHIPFSAAFYQQRDSAFHAVTIDPVYAAPLYDLDSNRALDSLGEISSSRWLRLKQSLADHYTILKGTK